MVHICGKRYVERAGETTEIKVYSNLSEVTLYHEGTPVETRECDAANKHVFTFTVPIEFPEDKWNVRCTLGDIYDNCPEAFAIVKKAVKIVTNFDMGPEGMMWDGFKNSGVEKMMQMSTGMPDGVLKSLNKQLIQFDKK